MPLALLGMLALLMLCLPLAAIGTGVPTATPGVQPRNSMQAGASSSNEQQTAQASGVPRQTGSEEEAAAAIQGEEEPKAVQIEALQTELPDYFKILNTATGKVQKVKRGDYVRGAVCAEMPPSFHTEALTAQAVAAHTYAVRWHLNQQSSPDPSLKGADFAADPDHWRGYVTEAQARERFGDKFDVYWGKLTEAADRGAEYVLVYEEEPIVAAYHSISAGNTEAASNVWPGEAPYLAPVESFGDTLAPNYETTVRFTPQEVSKALLSADATLALGDDPAGWLKITSRSPSGYALTVEAGGGSFTGQEIRTLFGLRSSDFEISYAEGAIVFTVRGYGHGVGLSQYGADYMARQGAGFEEILLHYYTDCQLAK